MSVTSTDLNRVVKTIWSTQLGLLLQEEEPGDFDSESTEKESIVIRLSFSGGFSGALEQRCSRGLSSLAASAAFASQGAELNSGEIRDVVAELAHMTAGNLKSMLPGDSQVSQPDASDPYTDNQERIAVAGFSLDGEPLLVTLSRQSSEV